MLNTDDHEVVIMKEDFNGVTTRKMILAPGSSWSPSGSSRDIQFMTNDIFPPGGARASSVGEASSYGVNHGVLSFVGHLQRKVVRMVMTKVWSMLVLLDPVVDTTILVKKSTTCKVFVVVLTLTSDFLGRFLNSL